MYGVLQYRKFPHNADSNSAVPYLVRILNCTKWPKLPLNEKPKWDLLDPMQGYPLGLAKKGYFFLCFKINGLKFHTNFRVDCGFRVVPLENQAARILPELSGRFVDLSDLFSGSISDLFSWVRHFSAWDVACLAWLFLDSWLFPRLFLGCLVICGCYACFSAWLFLGSWAF